MKRKREEKILKEKFVKKESKKYDDTKTIS